MRFNEIGQHLRAYRVASGLKAADVSGQLGISRAALYRYEKGEAIKLETIVRLAGLLKISPLTLLGIGVEYYIQPVNYAARLLQIEQEADQILHFCGPLCYLLTSDHYDKILNQITEEYSANVASDAQTARVEAGQIIATLLARKKLYQLRKPTMITILTTSSIQKMLAEGIAPGTQLSANTRQLARQAAYAELEKIASLMESEPLGLQLGIMSKGSSSGNFALFRGRERTSLAINPFPEDTLPGFACGVAMLTNAEDAIAAHQRAFEDVWSDALKGAVAAKWVRDLILAARE